MKVVRYTLATTTLVLASLTIETMAFVRSSFGKSILGRSFVHTQPPPPHQQHRLHLFDKLFGSSGDGSSMSSSSSSSSTTKYPIMADESVMSPKAHGTSERPVQSTLRWACDVATADRICSFNRHYAEYAGYWTTTDFLKYVKEEYQEGTPIQFYDSVTGHLLYTAPIGRSMADFLSESQKHGWPSFRDEETNWDYVRVLKNGECISTTGTHLGHNLPDSKGNRYCINLVSVAGEPEK
jgi:peptide methionine sulfoxide reductase MsrB